MEEKEEGTKIKKLPFLVHCGLVGWLACSSDGEKEEEAANDKGKGDSKKKREREKGKTCR